MHKRTQEERIFGRWVVVIDNSDYERFYNEKDAKEYLLYCQNNGIAAYIHHIDTDSEDDNIGYYFE